MNGHPARSINIYSMILEGLGLEAWDLGLEGKVIGHPDRGMPYERSYADKPAVELTGTVVPHDHFHLILELEFAFLEIDFFELLGV